MLKFDGETYGYFKRGKLSNGQTIEIFFLREYMSRSINYHVALAISTKRKAIKKWILGESDEIENQSTGKCGIEGLIWAKKSLFEFEDNILEKHTFNKSKPINILISGTDSRRDRIYTKLLSKYGYSKTNLFGSFYLRKRVR